MSSRRFRTRPAAAPALEPAAAARHARSYDITTSTLRDAALAPSTLRAYNKQLSTFLSFSGCSLRALLRRPPQQIDALLARFIDMSFAQQGSYEYANQALFGLIYRCPSLRLQLGESRLRLRGWKKILQSLRQSRSHPPLTWELAALFATVMAKWGRHAEAVATLLAFDCYLRVGELTRLTYADVLQPNDPRVGSAYTGMALRLGVTKTGPNQSVTLVKPQVQSVLLHYLATYPFLQHHRIFPFTAASFRLLLRQVSEALGVGHIPYVPHSLRHGGATYDYLRGLPVEQIMFRGRWVAMESARRYIQTSRALLIMLRIPEQLGHTAAIIAPHVDSLLPLLMESVGSQQQRRPRVRFSC
jgi:integrase